MDKNDLEDLLNSAPLPASADHARLVERLNKQQKAIHFLLDALATQGKSILDIRDKMIEHKSAIEMLAGEDMAPLPDVIIPTKKLVGFN